MKIQIPYLIFLESTVYSKFSGKIHKINKFTKKLKHLNFPGKCKK